MWAFPGFLCCRRILLRLKLQDVVISVCLGMSKTKIKKTSFLSVLTTPAFFNCALVKQEIRNASISWKLVFVKSHVTRNRAYLSFLAWYG